MVYSPPGVGKTTLAAHAPGAVFLCDPEERGVETLKESGLIPNVPILPIPQSWQDTLGILDSLATDEHKHKTLVMDTARGFEVFCHADTCQEKFNGDDGPAGFENYQKGYSVSLTPWRLMLKALDRLRDERQMSILMLAHSKVAPFRNPAGADYDRYVPDLHKETWAITSKWLEMILFCDFVTVVQSKGDDKKGKARGGIDRVMYTERRAAWEAKNRHNLPAEISMGDSGPEAWANLIDAIKAGRKSAETSE